MKFRTWLENEPPETQEFNPRNPPDGPETIEYMPDNEEGWGIGAIRDFNQILGILRQIDPSIPNPEGGWQPETRKPNGSVDSDVFVGTPDYASPEQLQPMTYNSLDNYERVLLTNIPQIFPNAAQEAKELAQIWHRFRNKVVHKSNVQEVAQRRPIHYALPLQELQRVLQTLRELGQVINASSDTETKSLAPEYQEIYRRHLMLMRKIGPSLKQQLSIARQNPFT